MVKRRIRLPQVLFAAFAILGPTAVGGTFGRVAGILYGASGRKTDHGWLPLLCLALGAAAGGYMGCLWLLAMRLVMKRESAGRIVAAGAVYGMLAGFLATIVFHLALGLVTSSGNLDTTFEHAFDFGMPAGFLTGLVCGLAAWGATKWSQRHD